MGVDLGGVEFYTGPPVLGGPDDLEAVVLDFINGAKEVLLIAVQALDSRAIAEAVIAAKAHGVRIQLILEGNYLTEDKPLLTPWEAGGDNEIHRTIHAALLRARIDVVTDLNPDLFHQKFVVRDPGLASAAVLTGSANFTLTDTGTNPPAGVGGKKGNNLNHMVVLRGKRVASLYVTEFASLRSGTFGPLNERHEPRPAELRLGGIRVKPLFAPQQGPEMEIMKQMLKSTSSVDFAMFTFSRSSGIDDTMIRLVDSLTRVRGILDRNQGAMTWAATPDLKAAGVRLFENKPGTGVRKVHHKLMVVDERLTIAGSFNYTAPGATLNDENLLVLGDLDETDPVAEARQRQIAAFALAEIDRITADLARPV
ncbi:phospholipase D-like domain-containing protein [Longispora sp. NPDC051575]|uniref:phospholipase D-like domain-containing protein n=1 Tax=Longispora sp. NPDC051575 TaxID=3154943 RepID=UPI00344564FE